ncbi:MAG: aminotransferase class V-fold PLP-dependent enzyme [Ignavibacterium sp.]|jgi:selenocysteine lyase/cysteine desulfurase|nr:MAG: aminotransferase class V-fold PLP-dependent enzyme [Ignavibacterium sp.]MDD5607952.1 aminotransferase class V-fold PLP-dependent enzyme [Ignavibacterium sp.]MDX9711227.1 aminotransferase class V-fold PLP-dependent enzyme [Ignavibacteriaceae bacterium]MEB2353639.1 aminotransferase class V-fold PLP-dependent enzyme [Ignavibacteriales bacterium]GIK20796.1 MAG: aminotransferase [Ignavibacteriota bacterium]
MNLNDIRTLFPYIKNDIIYFNHAATGPFSTLLVNAINKILKEKSERNIDDFNSFKDVAVETKSILASMLNTVPERLAFTDNTTNGLNFLAQSIQWKKGDRILLNDIEFPANVYPFLNLKRIGVEVDFVKSDNGKVTADMIIDAIKPGTKLISVSYVQFLSGYRIDLEKIGKHCKDNDIIFSVDAIQALGAVKLDVEKSNIDFLSCGTQKWLLGFQGLAFIYLNEKLQRKIIPANIGWLSVNNAWNLLDYQIDLKTTADVFQGGTINALGVCALNASLKLFNDFNFNEVEKRVLENSKYFLTKLASIGINGLLLNSNESELAGIVTFKIKDPDLVVKKLEQNKIICSQRVGMIRFSPHFYNIFDEIDRVVDVLQKN